MTCEDTGITVYYNCKYAPIELLAGFGAKTERFSGEADGFEAAERLAHGNLCGHAKAVLQAALSGQVKAVVVTTCCDAMRRVYDVLEAAGRLDFLALVDLPHRNGRAERDRLARSLHQLADDFGQATGAVFDMGRALAAFAEGAPEPSPARSVGLLGAHAPASLVDELGRDLSLPLANETCSGTRRLPLPPADLARPAPDGCGACEAQGQGQAGEDGLMAFLGWYAGALLDQTPCMRMLEVGGRSGATWAGWAGSIYHTMKFCDYYGFEYADLSGQGAPAGGPLLKIETDGTRGSSGQLRTRVEAFDETLRAASRESQAAKGQKGAAAPGRPTALGQAGATTYVLGVDSGSTSTDAVILSGDGSVVATAVGLTGAKASRGAERVIAQVLSQAGLAREDIRLCVATGYGRDAVPGADRAVTEITCHATGAHKLDPRARTVVDIGGQDSKIIHLDGAGHVLSFVMNDKCAAGTGRFLETMARVLEMPLSDLATLGLTWKRDVHISSVCTVFAESEVVSLVADDTPVPDIVHGLDMAVASKTAALAKRVGAEPPFLMTGGVAKNAGVVAALESVLGAPVATHGDSQLCGALGAALLGLEELRGRQA